MKNARVLRLLAWSAAAALPLMVVGPLASSEAAKTHRTAKVIRTVDGDTIKVDYDHDGRWDDAIRLIGIDTPEHNQCHYLAAKNALKSLVRHRTVTLTSDTGRIGRQNRPERRVIVPVGGTKVDATTWMLARGWGVWMPRKDELTSNRADHVAATTAALTDQHWFDEDSCGAGPAPNGTLSMHVQYASDTAYKLPVSVRRNEEFIRIRNDGPAAVNIDGWVLRVGNDRREFVPAGGAIEPAGTVTIHVGSGTNTVTDRYLGSSVPMLPDADLFGNKNVGGGSYLVDADGDIRAHMTWPCAVDCGDPTGNALNLGQLEIDPPGPDASALNGEVIALTNTGNTPIRTGDVVVEVSPWVYEFPPDHVLEPGETVRILGGSGDDDRLTKHLDAKNPVLSNEGARVLVRTYDSIVIDCQSWGGVSCPRSA